MTLGEINMATKFEKQTSKPLHIENTIGVLGKNELSTTKRFYTYRDMMHDSQIGGAMNLMQGLMNKLEFSVKAGKSMKKPEIKILEAIKDSFYEQPITFQQWMNYVLSELYYGHSMFEKVYVRKDGKMVVNVLSPIHPVDVQKYVYENLVLKTLKMAPAQNDGVIEQLAQQKDVDGDKVVMFKLNADLDNPLGRSMLDRVYVDWKSKQIASEYELIGIAKNLSGVVKIEAPSTYIQEWYSNPASDNARYLDTLLDQAELLHGGKSSVVMVASDVTQTNAKIFDITQFGKDTSTNTFDIDKTINRFNINILSSLYSDILTLGNSGGGSFALSDNKTNLLGLFIESVLSTISTGIKQVINELLTLNGVTNKDYTIVWDDIDEGDLEAFARAWARLGQSGLVTPTVELNKALREHAGVPVDGDEVQLQLDLTSSSSNERVEDDKQQ